MHEQHIDVDAPYRDTPYGRFYRPKATWVQIVLLFGAFIAGPALGWVTGQLLGGLSDNAQVVVYIPYVLVFFFGYGLWLSRLQAIAFEFLGRSIFRALFHIIVRRQRPQKLEDVLPTPEKLEQMVVRAQQASSSFLWASVPIGLLFALIACFVRSSMPWYANAAAVLAGVVAWGWMLSRLGRRGYLPLPEEGE